MRGRWIGVLVIVALAVFTWMARARSNGLPDAVGWVGLIIYFIAALALLRGGRRDGRTK